MCVSRPDVWPGQKIKIVFFFKTNGPVFMGFFEKKPEKQAGDPSLVSTNLITL